MRLKQMGLAAMLAVGALAAGSAWAQASRVEVFGQNARAERFDVYSDGARTGTLIVGPPDTGTGSSELLCFDHP